MTAPEPTFTRAAESDAETLLGIAPRFYADLGLAWDESVQPAVLSGILRHPDQGEIWLVHRDQQLIGYALVLFVPSLEFGGRIALLDEFFILPDQRGQGLGARFLEHLLKQLRAAGIQAVRLEVDEAHPGATRLYARHGFRRDRRELWSRHLA